jgi:hypothetical protein
MIEKFVKVWDAHKDEVEAEFKAAHPVGNSGIVEALVRMINRHVDEYGETPDPERIHRVDDGDYQGTLVFLIAATGYQPYTYWAVKVSYGSCSGCDTFEAIRSDGSWSDEAPNEGQVKDYMTLALHILQAMKEV